MPKKDPEQQKKQTVQSKPGFSDFGYSFQETFTKLILDDRIFCDKMEEVFDHGYLGLTHLQVFVRKVFEYRDKYGTHPSQEVFKNIIKHEIENETSSTQEKIRDFYTRSFGDVDTPDKIEDAEYVKDKAVDFCKKQKLYTAMEKSIELLNKSSFDDIATIINDAIKLGNDNDYGYDYVKDFEERFIIKHRNPISTGWAQMDEITKGGLGKGELAVVLGGVGSGKSMLLCHVGATALKLGKSVVHYTLELSDTHVANRYDAHLSGIEINELFTCKNHIYEMVKDVPGTLLIKEYPTKTASTLNLRRHLEKLVKNKTPIDLVIVDYADLLKPVKSYKEKRLELETIYEDLRAIAQEYKCPVWTCSQVNRQGLHAEIITMEAISEAFNKCFVADFIFSSSRTLEDKANNTGRFYIAKNRMGPDGFVFPVFMDLATVKIKVLENQGESIVDIDGGDEHERLSKKYKQLMAKKEKQKQ